MYKSCFEQLHFNEVIHTFVLLSGAQVLFLFGLVIGRGTQISNYLFPV